MFPHKYLINFVLLINVLESSCDATSSLTFVIDDTGSMQDDINEVKNQVDQIMDVALKEKSSEIKEFVLVSFNDPVVKLVDKTSDREQFKNSVNSLEAHNYEELDCPEMAMGGIIRGLEESSRGSYVFVFTDGSAKDYAYYTEVIDLCQSKQSQVVFVLTGDCGTPLSSMVTVYYDIATACSGQVFRVKKSEVPEMIKLIRISIRGKKSLLTSRVVPPYQPTFIPFTVDDKVKSVIITSSGLAVTQQVRLPSSSVHFKILMETSNIKACELTQLVAGQYSVMVSGHSSTSVVVTGKTNFSFNHGFSITIPKSLNWTDAQPIAGETNYLSVNIEDPENEVNIKVAQILAINEKVLFNLSLHHIYGNFYRTEAFWCPEYMIKIAVQGTLKTNGQTVRRISKTPVQPTIRTVVPELKKSKSPLVVTEKMPTSISCKVLKGVPKPMITWFYKGAEMDTFKSLPNTDDQLHFESTLLAHAGNYKCVAKNTIGRDEVTTELIVQVPPVIDKSIKKFETTDAKTVSISCRILRAKPMPRISWYFKRASFLSYKPLPGNENELLLHVSDFPVSAKFKCVAINKAGSDEYITDLIVTSKPEIIISHGENINVKYGGSVTITCFVTAQPEAIVEWRDNNNIIIPANTQHNQTVTGNMNYYYVSKLTQLNMKESKKYYCHSSNARGSSVAVIDVTVLSPFQRLSPSEDTINLEYGQSSVIPCKVYTEFPVKIKWFFTPDKSSRMESLESSENLYISHNGSSIKVKHMDLDLLGQYRCTVTLISDETKNQSYDVNINISNLMAPELKKSTSPLVVTEKSPVTISCTILKGVPKPLISWYFKSAEMNTFESLSNVGDQLHIENTMLTNAGSYLCIAKNKLGSYEVTTELVVEVPPVIDKSYEKIETTDAETVKILCKVLRAKPKPKISWYFKTVLSTEYKIWPENVTDLVVHVKDFPLSTKFKCIAENTAGGDEHVTDFIVTLKPKITIDDGSKISVRYGSTVTITCQVTAKPEATVEWRDNNNLVIPADVRHYQNDTGNMNYYYVSKLTQKNMKESKKYYCHSSNARGSSVEVIDVTVLSPFQRLGPSEDTINLEYRQSSVIPCKMYTEFPVKIKWFFTPDKSSRMESLESSENLYISHNGSSIMVKHMDLDLLGQYRCTVTLISDETKNQSYDVNINISNLMAPELKKSTSPLVVTEKSPVTISCTILKGVPKPLISWYFKSAEMNTFESLSNVGDQLHIENTMLTNAGSYLCIARNILGSHEVISQLVVEAPPRIINNIKTFKGVIGDVALRIPCNVTGYPKPVIAWTDRIKGESIVNDQKYMIEDGALVIKNLVVNDSKIYYCTAKNAFGSDTQPFKGIVIEDIDYANGHEVYILQGETDKIKCLLPHTASDSIRWYMNGNLMNETGSYVHFVNATKEMDGNYTCRVSNSLSSHSDTILVDVGYKPVFAIISNTDIGYWDGEGDLNCDVSAKPLATAEWFHNGKPIHSAKNNLQQHIFDWGEYSCIIRNVHGTVDKNFTVSSEVCLVNRNKESTVNTPFILTELSKWPEFSFTQEYLNFESGASIKLLCPNISTGFQKFPGKNEIDATCDHEDMFSFEGKLFKYSDFHCNEPVIPVIKTTGSQCLTENSEIIRVGFNGKNFVEAYDVCLDTHDNLPLYAHVTVTNARFPVIGDWLKWILYPEIKVGNQDKVYTCVNSTESCCYSKGQMINANDVSFGPMQTSTYVENLNAVPIWLPCTERTSWSDIEDSIRKKLLVYSSLSMWSGASKYTEKNEGKIPRYLWKVIRDSEGNDMAVVYVNTPEPEDSDIFCSNICDGEALLWLEPKDKFTYCCTMEDFLVAFELPKSIFV